MKNKSTSKFRMVARSYPINTYKADQMLRSGIINADDSVDRTGHKQVPITYNKALFQVADESGKVLEEIAVDEGMVDLLGAVWRHGIPTTHSCQGRKGETAWIRFESFEDAGRFLDLVSNLLEMNLSINRSINNSCEVSFPREDISKITEELNRQIVTQQIITFKDARSNEQ